MRRTLDIRILQLLLLAVVLNFNNDSLSAAYSPSDAINQRSYSRNTSRIRPHSAISVSVSSSKSDSPANFNSDDRRNQSLEQGNHPLWSLNLNLDSLAQAGAGSRAQELLRRIQALYSEGYYDIAPDIVSYNSVLKAWKEDEQPQAALELLETMIRNEREVESDSQQMGGMNAQDDEQNIRVDVISFNTVIAAFANQGNYRKALEILRKMQKNPAKKRTDDDDNAQAHDEFQDYFYPDPDTITYNIVLYSLAQSEDLGAAQEAENLLREMMMRKEKTGISVVDTTSFNTVLYAWSKEGEKNADQSSVDASTTSIGSKSKRNPLKKRKVSTEMAAQRAEDLLTIMEELSEAGNLNVRPDVYSYTTTIQCWAKCQAVSFANKGQDLLNRMLERNMEPNKLTYTALMNALSKAGNPEKAEYVLHQMIESHHQPDTVAFSTVIDGWAKISSKERPEAAARALQILETMKGNANQGMGPSATTYTSVLNALARSGLREACDQALDLLQDMEEEYAMLLEDEVVPQPKQWSNLDPKRDGWSMRPTNIHYNCVLNAYARSGRADKAIRAQKLMTVMENHSRLDCRPDTTSYNSLMMACAHATGSKKLRENSFDVALRTFKILVSNGNAKGVLQQEPVYELYPTSSTFANFFRACRKLLRPGNERRSSILTRSLPICCKLGMLNPLVVHQVQLACESEADWKAFAGELSEYVNWKDDAKKCGNRLPKEWTCNSRK